MGARYNADAIGRLNELITQLMSDSAHLPVLGVYSTGSPPTVTLDTGQVFPDPATISHLPENGERVLCFFLQGGHDVAVLPASAPVTNPCKRPTNPQFVYLGFYDHPDLRFPILDIDIQNNGGRIYAAEQDGQIWRVTYAELGVTAFPDVTPVLASQRTGLCAVAVNQGAIYWLEGSGDIRVLSTAITGSNGSAAGGLDKEPDRAAMGFVNETNIVIASADDANPGLWILNTGTGVATEIDTGALYWASGAVIRDGCGALWTKSKLKSDITIDGPWLRFPDAYLTTGTSFPEPMEVATELGTYSDGADIAAGAPSPTSSGVYHHLAAGFARVWSHRQTGVSYDQESVSFFDGWFLDGPCGWALDASASPKLTHSIIAFGTGDIEIARITETAG